MANLELKKQVARMSDRSPTSESPPKSPVRVSSRNEGYVPSPETNHVPTRGQNGDSDIQYVKATEVSSKPDNKYKDAIQVTAKAVNSRVSSSEKRRSGGDRRSGDFSNWDIDTLRLAYSDQRDEITFLETQLRAKDAKITQLEKENQYLKSQRH